MLQLDDQGPAVQALQSALKKAGFNPGSVDGDFGHGTEAAVMAFQASEGLNADGIAGPATLAALKVAPPADAPPPPGPPDVTAKVTSRMVAKMFPNTHLSNIDNNLPLVLTALRECGLGDKAMILMALGTIRAETGNFMPISEGISRFNTSPHGPPFDLYDNRKNLGNRGTPDGASFCGRGFVQLTGRANYAKFGPRLTPPADLVAHPELCNNPVTASKLLALFLKDNEKRIRTALDNDDLAAARKLVNGGSNGLRDFSDAYTIGLRLLPG